MLTPHFCGGSCQCQTKRPYGCWCQPGSGMACCALPGSPTQWRPDEIQESHQKEVITPLPVSLAYLFSITAAYAQTVQAFTLQNLVCGEREFVCV